MLILKQEKFCQFIIKGMSQTDAYREAFDIKIAKPESVYRMSYRLLRNVKIESRLEELKKGRKAPLHRTMFRMLQTRAFLLVPM